MVRLLVVVAPFAATCFCGAGFVGALSNVPKGDALFKDGVEQEEFQQKELDTIAKNGASPMTHTGPPVEASASSVPLENKGGNKKLMFAIPVVLIAIFAAVFILAIARKSKPPEDKLQQYALAVEKLQEAQAEAERLRCDIPILYEEVMEAYEEHFQAIIKRFDQAYNSLQASNMIPCTVVGKVKGGYLRMAKSSQPALLQEAWAQVQRHLDGELTETAAAELLLLSRSYAAEVEGKLELLKSQCAGLLNGPRDEIVEKLESLERDPDSVMNISDEPVSELDITYAQQFVHQVCMVHNRSNTFRTVKQALDPLFSSLTTYAERLREISTYTLKIEALKQAMEQSGETPK